MKKKGIILKVILGIFGFLIVVVVVIPAILFPEIRYMFLHPSVIQYAFSGRHTLYINNTFGNMENTAIKEIVQNEFKPKNTTYIRKITYSEDTSVHEVYKICVYYKWGRDCKKSNGSLGPTSYEDYDE